jgi:hypothetical protein
MELERVAEQRGWQVVAMRMPASPVPRDAISGLVSARWRRVVDRLLVQVEIAASALQFAQKTDQIMQRTTRCTRT